MDYSFLSKTILFRGASESEIESMLPCLQTTQKSFSKGETIFHAGDVVSNMGLVLEGSVIIENDDIWGNKSILSHVKKGQIFAETYSSVPEEALMVNVTAFENTTVLFINTSKILDTCSISCPHHQILIRNLYQISAHKNLNLSRRILHTSSKSIRGRLLSYLSEQALLHSNTEFTIPFNRQQLADYLNVDRSALSNELSKMKHDGILEYHKNIFTLKNR